jgi:hypothetical protein
MSKNIIIIVLLAIFIIIGAILLGYKNFVNYTAPQPAITSDTAEKSETDNNNCPQISMPGPDFCSGGRVAPVKAKNCVIGYECINTVDSPSCDAACKGIGYDSGKCANFAAGGADVGEKLIIPLPKSNSTDCVTPLKCYCSSADGNTCEVNADCFDPGCGNCLNKEWYDAHSDACADPFGIHRVCACVNKICESVVACGDGKCNESFENNINCPTDCH